MVYKYKAINISGKMKSGSLEANSEVELINNLKSSGYYIIDAYLSKQNKIQHGVLLMDSKVISIICRQIAVQMKAGITLSEAVKICINECSSSKYRNSLRNIYKEMQKGSKLSKCLSKYYKLYPELMIQMIEIGEETGTLDDILIKLSNYYLMESKIKKQISSSLTYPLFLIICTFMICIILVLFVLPQFINLLKQIGAIIPGPTLFLQSCINSLKKNGIFYIVSILIVILALKYYLSTERGRKIQSYMKLKIPIIKKIYTETFQLRFISSMHVLISAGFNPLKAIEISCSVSNEGLLKDRMYSCISKIKKGKKIYEAMSETDIFKSDFISMIKVGEESGNLKDTIKEVLDIMENDIVENYKKLTRSIEPILIIIIAFMMTEVIFAFLLPAIGIMDSLSSQI